MTELNKKNTNYKRVVFQKGKQKEFLQKIQSQLNLTLKEISTIAKVHPRTMTDWKREKFLMSLPALNLLCDKTKTALPQKIKIKNPFWYTSYGGSIGGTAVYKKYGYIGGNPEHRKKKWHEWWEKEGKFKKHPIINTCLPIVIPKKSSMLAEFIGIVLGDGCITPGQVTITLHKNDDKDFAKYVVNLFKKNFKIVPSIKEKRKQNIVNIVASRKKMVDFLVNSGLKIGSKVKQQTGVPSWISESKLLSKSCLRGLFDTDGCFYIDKHRYKNKIYYNCCMNFTNRSLPILSFFKNKLEEMGFHPTQKTKFPVFLTRESEILKYFKNIRSSNSKHLNKFHKYFQEKYGEVPKWS